MMKSTIMMRFLCSLRQRMSPLTQISEGTSLTEVLMGSRRCLRFLPWTSRPPWKNICTVIISSLKTLISAHHSRSSARSSLLRKALIFSPETWIGKILTRSMKIRAMRNLLPLLSSPLKSLEGRSRPTSFPWDQQSLRISTFKFQFLPASSQMLLYHQALIHSTAVIKLRIPLIPGSSQEVVLWTALSQVGRRLTCTRFFRTRCRSSERRNKRRERAKTRSSMTSLWTYTQDWWKSSRLIWRCCSWMIPESTTSSNLTLMEVRFSNLKGVSIGQNRP